MISLTVSRVTVHIDIKQCIIAATISTMLLTIIIIKYI